MPVTMGGIASGIDTDGLISKLLKVESRPIKKWEDSRFQSKKKKEALSKLSTRLSELNGATKELYGFRASYNEKKAISSNPAALDAVATKHAEKGVKRVDVLQLATNHTITTNPIKKDDKLPGGKFTLEVDGESYTIKFKKGTISLLQERIDEEASDIVSSSLIKTSEDKYVLSLQSKKSGKKGEIIISGDKKFLKKIGLADEEKESSRDTISLKFKNKDFTAYIGDKKIPKQAGKIAINKQGNSLTIHGPLWKEYILPVEFNVKEKSSLVFDFTFNEKKSTKRQFSKRIEMGPREKTVIKGIELHSYNVPRIRPDREIPKKKIDDIAGIGLVVNNSKKRIEKFYKFDKKTTGKQKIAIGTDLKDKKISKVIFYTNTGSSNFAHAKFVTPKKGKGSLEPKNVINKAQDAKIRVDGIEITRDQNSNLTDVIKGITLNLNNKTRETATINIEHDVTKAIDKIKIFVEKYNKYLEFTKILTKAGRATKPRDYKKVKNSSGLFVGDMSILRLENKIRNTITNAYPSRSIKQIKMLSQMGVSTGAVNTSWNSIKDGKLIIDESKLRESILSNPDGIKEFFASDNDGDNRIDNGLAFYMIYLLRPYIGAGNSVIKTKINYEESSILAANEKIEKIKEHLKNYESKLRTKFGAMEKAIAGAKSQGKWLQQQMKGGQGDKK